jgi:hypothetical protein
MTRRSDSERIYQAQRAGIFRRVVDQAVSKSSTPST